MFPVGSAEALYGHNKILYMQPSIAYYIQLVFRLTFSVEFIIFRTDQVLIYLFDSAVHFKVASAQNIMLSFSTQKQKSQTSPKCSERIMHPMQITSKVETKNIFSVGEQWAQSIRTHTQGWHLSRLQFIPNFNSKRLNDRFKLPNRKNVSLIYLGKG